jgi:hypothetical protein
VRGARAFSRSLKSIPFGGWAIRTRRPCVGRSIPLSGRDTFPDGQEIYYDTPRMTHSSEKHEILVVSGDNTTVIQLDVDSYCITFSADSDRLLVLKPSCIKIYDFYRVLECKSLAGGEISTIHLSKRPNSGLFVGQLTIRRLQFRSMENGQPFFPSSP